MYKLLSTLLFFPSFIFGQDISNSLGVVTISDDYDNSDHVIELLNSDGTVWNSINLYNGWDSEIELNIIAYKPDYFLFKIKCTELTKTGFKVVVNEKTGLTKEIRQSKKVKLQSWENYVIQVFAIDFESEKLSIYKKLNRRPFKETPRRSGITVPIEIKGDWMRIIWSETDNYPTKNNNDGIGWIKWKNDNKIAITVYHLS